MDRGADRQPPSGRPAGDGAPIGPAPAGRVPLAAVVVDREGLISHWSTGAGRLFGPAGEAAIGRPALDLLPVCGALPEDDEDGRHGPYGGYDGPGPGLNASLDDGLSHPAAGRARLTVRDGDRADVLWWAYPLVGPGAERLLVLAADAAGPHRVGGADAVAHEGTGAVEHVVPGFARHADLPDADGLARGLPGILPGMSAQESARIVAQVLELGYPVLEFSRITRVPVTPVCPVCPG